MIVVNKDFWGGGLTAIALSSNIHIILGVLWISFEPVDQERVSVCGCMFRMTTRIG